MGLEELAPGNTKRAKATAVAASMRFLKSESVTEEYVRVCIERDESGKCFVSVMDKFGMHLAFVEGKNGKPLARNTSMQYYRQTKLWLLDQFPQHRASLEARLLKMGKTLDNFCMKHDGGGFINKAPPCTKSDLKRMLMYLYVNANCSSDYQDAALLCLLWHLFGRASDLALLRKPNVSIDAGSVLFVRFIRMKTSEEQGLSLFAGTAFETCPMLAMALALLMQTAPCPNVIDNLTDLPSQAAISLSADVPLLEILDHPADSAGLNVPSAAGVDTTPIIYSHVNRVLDRISVAAGVKAALTSHSFRRGGAQHANGSGELTVRWTFDRSAWNMITTNKGFNYIFNTSKEDHKVSKILSGYDADAKVPLQDLTSFDSQTKATITKFQRLLSRAELLAWSLHLASPESTCEDSKPSNTQQQQEAAKQPVGPSNEQKIIVHQAAVINHFIEHTKRQDARMDALEAKLNNNPIQASNKRHKPETDTSDVSKIKKKQRRSAVTHLRATWYAWYAQEPQLWRAPISKQQKSDAKQLVAFMKLFLEDGFVLAAATPDYRDQVLALGARAEKSVLTFLGERSISSRGLGVVLKHLRALHRSGALNIMFERHERLLQTPAIQDPSPGYTQYILEQVSE